MCSFRIHVFDILIVIVSYYRLPHCKQCSVQGEHKIVVKCRNIDEIAWKKGIWRELTQQF